MLTVLYLFIPIALGIVLWLSWAKRKAEDDDWIQVAKKNGLFCRAGGWAGETTMSGKFSGHTVSVRRETRGSGNSRSTYTVYKVRYRERAAVDFELRAEGMWGSIRKLLGSQDIQVHDRTFDDAVLVKGRRAHKIVKYLTPERRARVLSILSSERSCVITGSSLRLERRGCDQGAAIIARLRRLAQLANILAAPGPRERPGSRHPGAARRQPPASQRDCHRRADQGRRSPSGTRLPARSSGQTQATRPTTNRQEEPSASTS